jgi:putative SOS response-associated peptidase YedK
MSDLLGPCPDARLALHPVTRAVGNVRSEGPELIAEIAEVGTRTH